MATALSPIVITREVDLSFVAPAVSTTITGLVGGATKGPVNEPTFISTPQQFLETFGEPTPNAFLGYASLLFLQRGNQLWVNRVASDLGTDAIAYATTDTAAVLTGTLTTPSNCNSKKIRLRFDEDDDKDITITFSGVSDLDDAIAIINAALQATDASTEPMYGWCVATGNTDELEIYSATKGTDAKIEVLPPVGPIADDCSTEFGWTSGTTDADGAKTVITEHPLAAAVAETTTLSDSPVFTRATHTGTGGVSLTADGDLVLNVNGRGEITIGLLTADTIAVVIGKVNAAFVADTRYGTNYGSVASLDTGEIKLEAPEVDATGAPIIPNADPSLIIEAATTDQVATDLGITEGTYAGTDSTLVLNIDSLGNVNIRFATTDNTAALVAAAINAAFVANANYSAAYNTVAAAVTGEVVVTSPNKGKYDSSINIVESNLVLDDDFNPTLAADRLITGTNQQKYTITFTAITPGTWANDLLEIRIIDEDPLFYAANSSRIEIYYDSNLVETYRQVTLDSAEAREGATYIENAIGTVADPVSAYITVEFDETSIDTTNYTAQDVFVKPTQNSAATEHEYLTSDYDLAGGADGLTRIGSADYIGVAFDTTVNGPTGLEVFANEETMFLNLLACPDGAGIPAVANKVISVSENRGDTLGIIDPPQGLTPELTIDWHNGKDESGDITHSAFNSSYGCIYGTWIQYFDSFNNQNVWLPPSCFVLPVIAYNDLVAEPWIAPAGLVRGLVRNALRVEYSPTIGQRNLMYGSGNAVNPIVNFPQEGIAVWGQRTLQRTPSALDRINVRRLLLTAKTIIKLAAKVILFEPNDAITRDRLIKIISPVLQDIQNKRGLQRFSVVDATTSRDIQLNQMVVKIFIQPTQSVEVIDIPFIISAAGVSFG